MNNSGEVQSMWWEAPLNGCGGWGRWGVIKEEFGELCGWFFWVGGWCLIDLERCWWCEVFSRSFKILYKVYSVFWGCSDIEMFVLQWKHVFLCYFFEWISLKCVYKSMRLLGSFRWSSDFCKTNMLTSVIRTVLLFTIAIQIIIWGTPVKAKRYKGFDRPKKRVLRKPSSFLPCEN